MAVSPLYAQRIADIQAQIAEVEYLRTRSGNMPAPPAPLGKTASKEELQQYYADLDAYQKGVAQANATQYQLDILHGEKKLTEAEAAQENAYTRVSNVVGNTKKAVGNRLSTSNKWLAHIPTPGGVWLPFTILMVLFLILFPVNGHSRMKWLFLVVLGQAEFVDKATYGRGSFVPTQYGNANTGVTGSGQVLYDQNTNPNQSPGQIVTSMPSPTPTNPPGSLIPFTVPLNDAGTTNYLDSLFQIGF